MNPEALLFLNALGAALAGRPADWNEAVTAEQLHAVLKLAEQHKVLPMIYQAIHGSPAVRDVDPVILRRARSATMQSVMLQTQKTAEFLPLLAELREAGAEPLVVKGIICRRLYPSPDQRCSSDEDLLIPPENYPVCHRILSAHGLTTPEPESEAYELPYRSALTPLYLEIHRSLFPPEVQAFGGLNRFFRHSAERAIEVDGIPTLCHTDHMLFLILHAFKHFIHSGFGIRQVCDMVLFANQWGTEIDWLYLLECCRQVRAERFAAGLFRIGHIYLGFSHAQSGYPVQWQQIPADEVPLLKDLLLSGVYGTADLNRQHSSTITLNAVSAQAEGKTAPGILKTVFPPVKALEKDYPYLKDKPILLPLAWAQRLIKYSQESGSPDNRATESIRVGKERIALLRQYGILDE